MSQQNPQQDNDMFYIAAAVGFLALCWFVSTHYSWLVFLWKWIKLAELSLFYVLPDWFPIYGKMEIKGLFDYIWSQPYDLIHKDTVFSINDHLSGWVTWPFAVWVIYLGFKRSMSTTKIDTIYNHDTLLTELSEIYPHLKPYVKDKPEYKSVRYDRDMKEDTYQYGCSLDPSDFALLSPPLGLEDEAKKSNQFKAIWDGDVGFDMDLAERAFIAQMGNRFTGIKSLNEVEKGVYDFFIKRMEINHVENIPKFKKYISSIIKVPNAPKINVSKLTPPNAQIYKLLKEDIDAEIAEAKKKKQKMTRGMFLDKRKILTYIRNDKYLVAIKEADAQDILANHAFIRCGLMSLFGRARSVGVIDMGELGWVKQHDRVLYYCLSSHGRKVSFVECSGPFAHWLVEQVIGEPLMNAEVSEAVNALKLELKLHEREGYSE
ncbi:hypothetical protein D051_0242 [Vibrio parahaemolyticus VPCR-2010]|uniref:secretion/conjugation apparatus DotM-related subunit n=1 Tax=Vibrio parahaemolyticus TaxID=670 RepID=UPI00038E63D9|nr:hypothetical protein D051_0242 [Vibrio parahaemolyticus VPCR-2010]